MLQKLLHLFFVVFIIVIVIIVFIFLGILCLLCNFNVVNRFPLCSKSVRFCFVISDDDIIKYCSALDLPQVKTDKAKVPILVNFIVIFKFGVVNFLRFPHAFIFGVGDTLYPPLSLVFRIVFHGCLPLTVLLIIPIIWLRCILIDNSFFGNPIIRLLILGIIHHG